MAVPSSVQKVFDDANVRYQVAATFLQSDNASAMELSSLTMNADQHRLAKVIVLSDGNSKIQAIIPGNCLLDLDSFYAATKRQCMAVPEGELLTLASKHGLKSLTALPQLTGLETFVDDRLLALDSVLIESQSGEEIKILEVSKADYQSLVSDANTGKYSVPLGSTLMPKGDWQKSDIAAINNAVQSFTSLRIQQRLEETLDMPPMPETSKKIINMRMDPDAESVDLAAVVEQDPGLAAQVVSWANSSFYSLAEPTKSVHEAVIRVLGFDLVINLALGLSLGRTLSFPKGGPFGYSSYWQSSVYCATLMGELARKSKIDPKPTQGLAYLCGLLHNFGYLILGHVFPPHFEMINRHGAVNKHINRYFIENHLLGITREQISAGLMKQWGVPDEVCYALRYQNEPDYEGEHAQYAYLMFVAQRMLRGHDIGDAPNDDVPDDMWLKIGVTRNNAHEVMENMFENSESLQQLAKQLAS